MKRLRRARIEFVIQSDLNIDNLIPRYMIVWR